MEDRKLKSCPFCGGRAVFRTFSNSSSHHCVGFDFDIECSDCGMTFPKRFKVRFSMNDCGEINSLNDERERAAEQWNSRAQPEEDDEE